MDNPSGDSTQAQSSDRIGAFAHLTNSASSTSWAWEGRRGVLTL